MVQFREKNDGSINLEDLTRDDYASSIRNKLIAEAFYLTGDIERYGTGFVRIRKALKDYPEIVMSFEEISDFFRVNLRIIEPVTPPRLPLRLPPGSPPRLKYKKLLLHARISPVVRKYRIIKPALEQGVLEMVFPDKPSSPQQQYRLTELGRQWLEMMKRCVNR